VWYIYYEVWGFNSGQRRVGRGQTKGKQNLALKPSTPPWFHHKRGGIGDTKPPRGSCGDLGEDCDGPEGDTGAIGSRASIASRMPFNLRWKHFSSNLSSALRDDAFDRFADYFKIPSIRVTSPTGSTFKRALSKVDKEKIERARKRQKN
jgi:hypothetical protein